MSTTTRTRALVLLVAAFAAGIVVGVAGLTTAFRAGKADFIWHGPNSGRAQGGTPGGLGARVAKELDVKDAQRDSIIVLYKRGSTAMDSIMGSIRTPMDSLWETVRPMVETRRQQTRTEVRALLTPPQQVRYDSMNQASDENRKKMRDQFRGGSRGPH